MSKPTFICLILFGLAIATAFGWRSAGRDPGTWPEDRGDLLRRAVLVPAGVYPVGSREPDCYPPRLAALPAFYIWPVEVPRSWWARYAGSSHGDTPDLPAVAMSYDEAEAFCAWLSEHLGATVRLPTVDEWQAAARAGTKGATYPWGWALPDGHAVYDTVSASPPGRFPANPWGLHDMAGNVAEWCRAPAEAATAPVMGGSWAERSGKLLRISHRLALPKGYRDEDVGFRFVIEDATGNR